MHKWAFCVTLGLLLSGCLSTDSLFLSSSEANALVENVEGSVEAQQLISEYAFELARGDVTDLSGFTYDSPTALNNFVGTLSGTGNYPFGNGDFTMTFTTTGDAGPVDPQLVDLTDDAQVVVDAVVHFDGTSNKGVPLTVDADFVSSTTQNTVDSATTVIDGTFDVNHGGYVTDLAATKLQLALDLVQGRVTEVFGDLDASVDIPGFAFDADLALTGLGDQLRIGLDVLATTINYDLALGSLF